MKVAVVHQRDPDYSCTIQVFVNGLPVEVEEFDFDPGAGYRRADWEESRRIDILAAQHHGLAVHAAVMEAYESASESEYIVD